jgi:hypothetical protein
MLYRMTSEPGGGSYPRHVCKVLNKIGTCRDKFWEYNKTATDRIDRYIINWQENRRALGDAKKYKIKGYVRLDTVQEMVNALVEHGPFVLGMDWDSAWFKVSELGRLRWKNVVGRHMFTVVGVDNGFKIFNSWGKGWGQKGFGFLPFETITEYEGSGWLIRS